MSTTRLIGWVGVTVLYGLAEWQLLLPTGVTFVGSTRSGNILEPGGIRSVGLQNWVEVFPLLLSTLGFVIVIAIPPMLLSVLLGLAIATAMKPSSLSVRFALGVLTALFVPLGVACTQLFPAHGAPAPSTLIVATYFAMGMVPLLTAVCATAFAAAWAIPGAAGMTGRIVALALLGAVAIGLQVFALPLVVQGAGDGTIRTPLFLGYESTFLRLDFGRGMAIHGITLLILGAMGLLAVALIAAARPHLVARRSSEFSQPSWGFPGTAVVAVVVIGALMLTMPVFVGPRTADVGGLLVAWNTLVPVLVAVAVQLVIATLGGIAIGWCRPAGRGSLWLLLPLSPWLFVGEGALAPARFLIAGQRGTLNSWLGLIPSPFVVAAVVVLAVVFAGARQRAAPGRWPVVMSAICGVAAVLFVVQAQALFPALVMVGEPKLYTGPIALIRSLGAIGAEPALGSLYQLPTLVPVAALAVVAQLGLRHAALVRG